MALDLELMETKEFKALAKAIGEKNAKEFIQKDTTELKENISLNTLHVNKVQAAKKANEKYQEHCEAKKLFDSAATEECKPHELQIRMASVTIRSRQP